MDFTTSCDFDGHENVVFMSDVDAGLVGVIAIHSTALGPAFGGCRVANYLDPQAALTDALRLSRGMTYKNAMAGLAAGGGKAVLHGLTQSASRERVFEAFGQWVDSLGGRYITAIDVGTHVGDMQAAARATRFVAGLPNSDDRAGGDPSPSTALGVFVSMQAVAERPLQGLRISVQGLGSVGYKLCRLLHGAGARLVVADISADRAEAARHEFGAEIVTADRIHAVAADVFSPNAMGAVLNADTIAELGAPTVCGGANNQLKTSTDGNRLFDRGVIYAPDYVVNAGGIIHAMAEYGREPRSVVEDRVRAIGPRVAFIVARAQAERRPSHLIADEMARERVGVSSENLVPTS